LWGALSDERSGLSFVCGAGPCQRSLSRVRVPWDLRPYFTVSHSRLPFSSPPMTRRVTVEVFDPISTRVRPFLFVFGIYMSLLLQVHNLLASVACIPFLTIFPNIVDQTISWNCYSALTFSTWPLLIPINGLRRFISTASVHHPSALPRVQQGTCDFNFVKLKSLIKIHSLHFIHWISMYPWY
jgi:hypothetical protein